MISRPLHTPLHIPSPPNSFRTRYLPRPKNIASPKRHAHSREHHNPSRDDEARKHGAKNLNRA